MGYDAHSVEALDFDFTGLQLADEKAKALLADAKGTIPEPSQQQIEAFSDAIERFTIGNEKFDADNRKLAEEIQSGSVTDADRTKREKALRREEKRLQKLLYDAVAALCAGVLTAEQFAALPARHQLGFTRWLGKALAPDDELDPTAPGAPGTTSSLAALNGAGSPI